MSKKNWCGVLIVLSIALLLSGIIVNLFGEGKEQRIDGVICKKFANSWVPVANFCVNCKTYQLSEHCGECGTKMPLVIGKRQCIKCKRLTIYDAEHCGQCGGKFKIVLVTRN